MLGIDMEFKKGILFVRLSGILNGDTASLLDKEMTSLIETNGIRYVVLNLKYVEYIDKYGILVVRKNYKLIEKVKGKLMICGIKKLFSYTNKLTDYLYQLNEEASAYYLVGM